MKAAIYSAWGSADVLRIADVAKPAPADNEVLIAVKIASVNPLDWRLMRGKPYLLRLMFGGPRRPNVRPGRDVAGIVEAVGRNVTRFKVGDAVFGLCKGAFAEYACAVESALASKPEGVDFEQVGCAPIAALTALQALRDHARLARGRTVLINGAAGGVGTFAVQIAKALGAHVTGVCSGRNAEMVRSIGADRVIDYMQEDFTSSQRRYDVVLDCVANHGLSALRRVLNDHGVCVIAGAPKGISTLGLVAFLIRPAVFSSFASRKFRTFLAKGNAADLSAIGDLVASAKVKPVIDRRYELSQVADAVGYLEQGHARGKVLIAVGA